MSDGLFQHCSTAVQSHSNSPGSIRQLAAFVIAAWCLSVTSTKSSLVVAGGYSAPTTFHYFGGNTSHLKMSQLAIDPANVQASLRKTPLLVDLGIGASVRQFEDYPNRRLLGAAPGSGQDRRCGARLQTQGGGRAGELTKCPFFLVPMPCDDNPGLFA